MGEWLSGTEVVVEEEVVTTQSWGIRDMKQAVVSATLLIIVTHLP